MAEAMRADPSPCHPVVHEERELIRAKHRQAAQLMPGYGLDCWLVQFARETELRPDPTGYLVGMSVTWPSAFLLRADGRSAAVVATGDQAMAERLGVWDEVHPYVTGVGEPLRRLLDAWGPERIGVTWDRSDNFGDGITHGMYLELRELLAGTVHADRLVAAGPLASAVRMHKLPEEIAGIARAVRATEEMHERIGTELLKLGVRAAEVMQQVHVWIAEAGYDFAWGKAGNPMVDFGAPDGPLGHLPAGDSRLEPGQLAHIDLGLVVDGFAADIQRLWYLPRPGETEAPLEVTRAVETVAGAIELATETMAPGVKGHEVDAAGRGLLTSRGYWDPPFAFGHHLGRFAHDGGGVLGPRWERYGDLPDVILADGNVFAVETSVVVDGYGIVGLEEDVVIEDGRARYLSSPQRSVRLLAPPRAIHLADG